MRGRTFQSPKAIDMTSSAAGMAPPVDGNNHQAPISPRLQRLERAIEHAAHLLPAQGPITVFIHHNTLHGFEDLPFTEAVKKGAKVFGCQPYLSENRYREELKQGRIRSADLEAVLRESLGTWTDEKIVGLCTRKELRLAMLQYPLRFGPTEELLWFVAETDALRRIRDDASAAVRERLIAETRRWVMRDLRGNSRSRTGGRDIANLSALIERFGETGIERWSEETWEAFTLQALWRVCCDAVAGVPEFALPPMAPSRHRDLLVQATGVDSDLLVHDVLIRFCGAFLDQGLAHWQLPQRAEGFYRSFCALYEQAFGPPDHWLRVSPPSSPGSKSETTVRSSASLSPWMRSASPSTNGKNSSRPRCWHCAAGPASCDFLSSAATARFKPCRRAA